MSINTRPVPPIRGGRVLFVGWHYVVNALYLVKSGIAGLPPKDYLFTLYEGLSISFFIRCVLFSGIYFCGSALTGMISGCRFLIALCLFISLQKHIRFHLLSIILNHKISYVVLTFLHRRLSGVVCLFIFHYEKTALK